MVDTVIGGQISSAYNVNFSILIVYLQFVVCTVLKKKSHDKVKLCLSRNIMNAATRKNRLVIFPFQPFWKIFS